MLREVHPMPKVDTTLAQLSGATVFSKLDANSGFWQIPLADESKLLTHIWYFQRARNFPVQNEQGTTWPARGTLPC